MEKTEMMKKYEQETGEIIGKIGDVGDLHYIEYVEWLEAKASAYDRIMSGGRKTLKEWANIFGMPVVINACRIVFIYENIPRICCGIWCGQFVCSLSRDLSDFNGDWKDSLTLPDGWEEA